MGKIRIRVYNPCNQATRFFRNYNLFWDRLTEHLGEVFEVEENRYAEKANSDGMEARLAAATKPMSLRECEYVIENMENGEFCVLSVCDVLTSAVMGEKHNPKFKRALIAQFLTENVKHDSGSFYHKYSPWIYFPMTALDLDVYYYLRKQLPVLIDKMYFRGATGHRPILSYVSKALLEGTAPIGGPDIYFPDVIKYSVGLAVGGRGEICYRDVEYMAMGIPFIKFEYRTELCPPLIPNFHYVSIDRPSDMKLDGYGDEKHAKLIEAKFLEVKDNREFLAFVAKNAREYYVKYLAPHAAVEHTMELLGIERDWAGKA